MSFKIGLLGHGVVGRGVDEIVTTRVEGVEVTRILELPDRCGVDPRMTSSFDDLVTDDSIDAIVECMGGIEPAHTYIAAALNAGKHVVTSNKAVVAAHFSEFVELARKAGVGLHIEATCGGGIPWIASIAKARRIDEICSISGIMNGTTNYLVDTMAKTGEDFTDVLVRAQKLGYAERDPSADIDGIDVANKTAIACGVAFGVYVSPGALPVTGIRTLTRADMELFASLGRVVKLLGRGVVENGAFCASVEPVAVDAASLEAHVPANFNLVTLVGTTVGELKFYGQGAGSLPTGNAMVQDILDAASNVLPAYDLGASLRHDQDLLRGDYIFRTSVPIQSATEVVPGAYAVSDLTPQDARLLYERVLTSDPTAFMAAYPTQ